MTMPETATSPFNIQIGNDLTWNVMPLLHEVKHAFNKLIESGETTVIDLRSIPLAPGEEDRILQTLGVGEIQAKLNALGPSEITETRYAGIWIVTHYNDEEDIIGRFIEVTMMPEILCSQREDMIAAYEAFDTTLEENNESSVEKSE